MKSAVLSLIVMLLISDEAAAKTVPGLTIPDRRQELQLQGAGLLRKGLFFKIYAGALYLKKPADAARVLTEVSKRIDIYYLRETPKKQMIRVANKTLRLNLKESDFEKIYARVEQLHAAYLDGGKGSVASLIYHPGKGLTYAYNSKPCITIPGDDFANAYFTIWLGKHPSSRSMKQALLKGD